MGNYSAKKKKNNNAVLIHATTWINLENIKLSEGSHSQKIIYGSIYMKCLGYIKIYRDGN